MFRLNLAASAKRKDATDSEEWPTSLESSCTVPSLSNAFLVQLRALHSGKLQF